MITASEKGKAMGGTELMALGLSSNLGERFEDFQIVCSRVRELDESKFRIFWGHDLPEDPESHFLKDPNLRDRFHHFVFVSNWQLWAYATHYQLPMDRCSVIPNAITPIEPHIKPDPEERVNLIYFSTPHRGLELLVPVFDRLHSKFGDNIHLDVYSSFSLYGWSERDKPYEQLFERCRAHPGITYHGAKGNEEIREALKKAHILAYPSIWQETSCIVLIESMSAGLECVHSNLAALPETSAGLTQQYNYIPDPNAHAIKFMGALEKAITTYTGPCTLSQDHVTRVHSWDSIVSKWEALLNEIRAMNPSKMMPRPEMFTVKAN